MSYSASSWGGSCSGGSADKLVSVTDANNNITRYEYNLNGELVKETDPRGNITSSYDVSGRLSPEFPPELFSDPFQDWKMCGNSLVLSGS